MTDFDTWYRETRTPSSPDREQQREELAQETIEMRQRDRQLRRAERANRMNAQSDLRLQRRRR